MKTKFFVIIFLTVTAFLLFKGKAFACAPGFSTDVYEAKEILMDYYPLMEGFFESEIPENHPIFKQKYEVITPGWGAEYLLPVYLSSENKELSDETKNALFKYYHRVTYTPYFVLDDSEKGDEDSSPTLYKKWLEIRNFYINEPYPEDAKLSEYQIFYCAEFAFGRAVEDFEYRKAKFSEAEIENWVKGQDKVFLSCLSDKTAADDKITKTQSWGKSIKVFLKNFNKKPIPIDDIPTSKLLKFDQEYQEAAGAYYSGDYVLAAKLFREIINNKSHPHRRLAALSLGWSFIGWDMAHYEADLKDEKSNVEGNYLKNLGETQKYYEKMYFDPDFAPVKYELQKYLDFVTFRTDPVTRFIDAEKTLLDPGEANEFTRQLDDFNRLWYKYFQRVLINQKEEAKHKEFRENISKSQSPFLRFLLEWEKPTPEGIQYSLDNYKNNNNPLWLILALRQSNEGQKDFGFIKEEINKIKPESPFYLTAQYYLLEQLVKDQNNKEEAKSTAEKFIKNTYANNQLVAFNLFSDIRENLSSDPKEAVKFSIRYSIATYDYSWDSISTIPYYTYGYVKYADSKDYPLFSNKEKLYLSSLSPADLSKFIVENSNSLPNSLKGYLKLTAFDRSFVLDDLESADLLARDIVKTDSVLSASFNRYLSAGSDAAKTFMAAKILIDYPRVFPQIGENLDYLAGAPISYLKKINDYRLNWVSSIVCMKDEYKPDNFIESEVDKKVADKNSVNYLIKTIVDYMVKNPSYSDPELLHKVVDVGHYAACQDKETSEISRKAFQLLHSGYPDNYWTKQTPYWY